jgi:serine phosphatase RsbU (regulator of sigma subunit)
MGFAGKEIFRIKTELQLAQSIQKTLVPPLSVDTSRFEIFGISEPSEKVGGDLVDVVEFKDGDVIAYVADIAGHGLQAGILMGMLKTAARTALTDAGQEHPDGTVLSVLMQRLNLVLPQVKESHMYATFTALRLNADGQAFYGLAGSPPLLHWRVAQKCILRIEEQQFPLGLLPVPHFGTSRLEMAAGDIAVVATDGILEVTSNAKASRGVEYGVDALETLISGHADLPLSHLAAFILQTVRSYGKQLDDQTLLLVRRVK